MLNDKPWRIDWVLRLLMGILACLALSILIVQGYRSLLDRAGGSPPLWVTLTGTLTSQGIGFLLIDIFLRKHQVTWSEAFGLKSANSGRALLLALVVGMFVVPISWSLTKLSILIFEWLHISPKLQDSVQALQMADTTTQRVYFAVVAILIAPIFEELVFRGILYPTLKRYGSMRLGLWGSSIFFGMIHMSATAFVPLTLLAVVMCLLYETTGTIVAPIVTHAFFNAANYTYLILSKS